ACTNRGNSRQEGGRPWQRIRGGIRCRAREDRPNYTRGVRPPLRRQGGLPGETMVNKLCLVSSIARHCYSRQRRGNCYPVKEIRHRYRTFSSQYNHILVKKCSEIQSIGENTMIKLFIPICCFLMLCTSCDQPIKSTADNNAPALTELDFDQSLAQLQ